MSQRIGDYIRSNILGFVAIFIALSGTATAVQVAGHSPGTQVAKKKKVKRGPPGPQGPQGPQGLPGPATGPAGGELSGSYPNPVIPNPAAVGIAPIPAGSTCNVTIGTFCGAAGNGWTQPPSTFGFAGYFVDAEGFVHLQGHAHCVGTCNAAIFSLPIELTPYGLGNGGTLAFVAYRAPLGAPFNSPAAQESLLVQVVTSGPSPHVIVQTTGAVNGHVISLNGITWRTG